MWTRPWRNREAKRLPKGHMLVGGAIGLTSEPRVLAAMWFGIFICLGNRKTGYLSDFFLLPILSLFSSVYTGPVLGSVVMASVICRGDALLESEDPALCSKRNDNCARYKESTMIDMINLYSVLRAYATSHLQRFIELRIKAQKTRQNIPLAEHFPLKTHLIFPLLWG